MIALLLAASSVIVLLPVLLVGVVVGIRQKPSAAELSIRPPTRLAALVRLLLGVSVHKPGTHATGNDQTPESCGERLTLWPVRSLCQNRRIQGQDRMRCRTRTSTLTGR
jgi:hypothetical protein